MTLILLGAWTPQAVGAEPSKEIEARRAFVSGEYDRAIELFAELYAETLHPVYLRNLGRCHQRLGHPAQAIDFFHQYLNKGRSITPDERDEIKGYISEMEQLQKDQAHAAEAANARKKQTQPPVEEHARAKVALAPVAPVPASGSSMTLASHPSEPEPTPHFYSRWWFWSAVGVLVAGGATAVLLSRSTTIDKPPCPMTCFGP